MTNGEILKKAIEKAVKNGFKYPLVDGSTNPQILGMIIDDYSYMILIFSHDFAKAFWGEDSFSEFEIHHRSKKVEDEKYQGWKKLEKWQYHLQLMVLEENPIKYLEKFI